MAFDKTKRYTQKDSGTRTSDRTYKSLGVRYIPVRYGNSIVSPVNVSNVRLVSGGSWYRYKWNKSTSRFAAAVSSFIGQENLSGDPGFEYIKKQLQSRQYAQSESYASTEAESINQRGIFRSTQQRGTIDSIQGFSFPSSSGGSRLDQAVSSLPTLNVSSESSAPFTPSLPPSAETGFTEGIGYGINEGGWSSVGRPSMLRLAASTAVIGHILSSAAKPKIPPTTQGWCLTSRSLKSSFDLMSEAVSDAANEIPDVQKEAIENFKENIRAINLEFNKVLSRSEVVVSVSTETVTNVQAQDSASTPVQVNTYISVPQESTELGQDDSARVVGSSSDIVPMSLHLLDVASDSPYKHLSAENDVVSEASSDAYEKMLNEMGFAVGNGKLVKTDYGSFNAVPFKRLYQVCNDLDLMDGLIKDEHDFIVITTRVESQSSWSSVGCKITETLSEKEVMVSNQENIISGGDYDYLYVFWKDKIKKNNKNLWRMDQLSLDSEQKALSLTRESTDFQFTFVLDTTLWESVKDLGTNFLSVDKPYGIDTSADAIEFLNDIFSGNVSGTGLYETGGSNLRSAAAPVLSTVDFESTSDISDAFEKVRYGLEYAQREQSGEDMTDVEPPDEDFDCGGLDVDLDALDSYIEALETAHNNLMAAVKTVQGKVRGITEEADAMVKRIESFMNNKLGSLSSILACLFGGFGVGLTLPSLALFIFEALDTAEGAIDDILNNILSVLDAFSATLCISSSTIEALLPISPLPGFLSCFSLGIELPDCVWELINKIKQIITTIQTIIGAIKTLLTSIRQALRRLLGAFNIHLVNKMDTCNDPRLTTAARALKAALSS